MIDPPPGMELAFRDTTGAVSTSGGGNVGIPVLSGPAGFTSIHDSNRSYRVLVADRPDGHVSVRTAAARGEDGALRAVRLTVLDNGPGFAEHVLKRAFEPYVTTKAKGTGLGLAVVKKIADEHRARLRVANVHAGDDPDAPVVGARVSLSFSDFLPGPPAAEPGPVAGDASRDAARQAH